MNRFVNRYLPVSQQFVETAVKLLRLVNE